jgi:hypothetical protein
MLRKLRLQPLELLDLARCHTVSDVVDAMSRCAFGARMLGEVGATLTHWCSKAAKPTLIYDGIPSTPLGRLLSHLVQKSKFFSAILTPEQYAKLPKQARSRINALVIGGVDAADGGHPVQCAG